MIKVLADSEYTELLKIKSQHDALLKNLQFDSIEHALDSFNSIKHIYNLSTEASEIFKALTIVVEDDEFFKRLNSFTKILRNTLGYEFVIMGYKKNSVLIDLEPSSDYQIVTDNNHLKQFKTIDLKESLVGKILVNESNIFCWERKEKNEIIDINFLNNKYPKETFSKANIENLNKYFSFLRDGLKQLIICPIVLDKDNVDSILGYIILANKKNHFNSKNELMAINLCKVYLTQVYASHFLYRSKIKDADFINKLHNKVFPNGIYHLLKHFCDELDLVYSSFWVPSLEEESRSFVLGSCYSKSLNEEILSKLKDNDFYHYDECIIGDIMEGKYDSIDENNAIFWVTGITQEKVGFKEFNLINTDQIIVIPIYKNHNDIDSKLDNKLIGVFCLYPETNHSKSAYLLYRLSRFVTDAKFYIEHIIYDDKFHTTEAIRQALIDLPLDQANEFYDIVISKVKELLHCEHASIFLTDRSKGLYLKSSTAGEFRKVDKKTKEFIQIYKTKDYIDNADVTIYKDDSSITYRAFKNNKSYIIHDVHGQGIKTNCNFCEGTKSHHESLIVVPIIVDKICIGVIRCVNKESKEDSLSKYFTELDIDTLNLLSSFISSYITKIDSLNNQHLFIEHLAHENGTPVQVIWSAIDNIETKLQQYNESNRLSIDLSSNFERIIFNTSVLNNNYSNLNLLLKHEKMQYLFEEIDLKTKIYDIVRVLKPLLIRREGKPIQFSIHIGKMPLMRIDEARMYQVIYNLLSNAVRYSSNSTVVEMYYKENISIDLNGRIKECCEIKVCNYGIGIKEGEKELIFKEYYRSKEAQDTVPNGTGIGLYVVRQIINGHGGKVSVTKLDNPTTFSIYLPLEIIV